MRRRQAPLWPLMALTVAIALMAFILSFDALRTLAMACGVQPGLSWMFPLIIDAPVLAFTWATWVFKTRGLGQAYPWAMLLVFSTVSLVGNALHARPVETNGLLLPDWGASLLMTMPPVALLATSHMIVRAASRSFDMEPEPDAGEAEAVETETAPASPESEPEPAPAKPELEPQAASTEAPAPAEPEPIETAVAPQEPQPAPVEDPAPAESEPAPTRWRPDFSAPAPTLAPVPEEPEPEAASEPESDLEPVEASADEPKPETLEERWGRAFAGDGRDRLVDLIEPGA